MAEIADISMDTITARSFSTLSYRDPKPFLVDIREIEYGLANSNAPIKIKTLRTNKLKECRELREAALFCYFLGERIGTAVYLAKVESQDYDFVASWIDDSTYHFMPVQIKEVVPEIINKKADISTLIEKLNRYTDSSNLIVAIHINRDCHFNPIDLKIPNLAIGQIWAFGATSPDQNEWGLWGDFCEKPERTIHKYPMSI
jgi:hypothetical protein